MATMRHIGSLESVRGIAALSVCLFHAGGIHYQGAPIVTAGSPLDVLLNGHGAVILFFVLSGYVLRLSLERRSAHALGSLARDFLNARVFRLFPVIIATIAVFVIVFQVAYGEAVDIGLAIRNALLLDTTLNGTFWTLQVEIFGSILILLAFLVERRFGLWAVAAMTAPLLLVSFLGSYRRVLGPVEPSYFYAFLIGYLAAALPRPNFRHPATPLLMIAVALFGFYWAHYFGNVLKQWLLLVTVLCSTLLIVALASDANRNRLHWRPVRLLGRLSYSYYALHPLGLRVAAEMVGPLTNTGATRWIAASAILLTAAAIPAAIALPMYYLIERPGIELGRRICAPARALRPAE
jgi:peptidoglycan/LPS O-acetylase OafA/YrhL